LNNTPILLAQCKAYHSIDDIAKEIETLLKIDSTKDFHIHVSLPYSYIEPIAKKFPNGCLFGSETILPVDEGSFTASVAGKLLQEVNAKFVLIGTPEERALHPTTHHLKNKIKAALDHQIVPFVCIADTLQQHQDKESKQVLTAQIKECLEGFSPEELKKIFIVYNAEWISSTPWEAKSPDLEEAYTIFKEVVQEVNMPPEQLIAAIPAYSQEAAALVETLSFAGCSVGILSESAAYLQPLKKT
jgi:triosephosphate isomerase (TIM)